MTAPMPSYGALVQGAAAPGAPVAAASRLAPLRAIALSTRQHPWCAGASAVLIAAIGILSMWNDGEVQKALQEWDDAAKLLGGDQFGAAMAALMPDEDEWTTDDRDAFDASIQQLMQEVDAIVRALETNKEVLAQIVEVFRSAIDGLISALVPILVAVMAAIPLLAFPATNPFAIAVGAAGGTALVFVLTEVWSNISDLVAAARAAFSRTSVAVFADGSRPGWAAPGTPDPNIRDIVINYNLDASAYRK